MNDTPNIMEDVILYILCRTDLGNMAQIAGLMAAQAAHASNQMVHEADAAFQLEGRNGPLLLVKGWQEQTGKGFGTTITLAVNETQLRQKVTLAKMFGHHAGITHDPTFPVRNGEVVHLIPVDTCGYVLGRKGDLDNILGDLRLVG